MKGKKLSGAMICIVVSLVVMFAFTGCNPDVKNPDFAGGDGSAASPYIIKNVEQLKNVAKYAADSLYYKLGNDIDVTQDLFITKFNGTLDGNSKKISVTDDGKGIADDPYCALFGNCSGEIKNLNFYTKGIKAIALYPKDMTYTHVDTFGEQTVVDNNVGVYAVHVRGDVTFKDCTNNANMKDIDGIHYGAPFIGGMVLANDSSIVFDGCINKGNIFFGDSASVFIGNGHLNDNITNPPNVTFKNSCSNTGTVVGGLGAALVAAVSHGSWDTYCTNLGNVSGSEKVKVLYTDQNFAAAVDTAQLKYEITPPSSGTVASYAITGTVRVKYYDSADPNAKDVAARSITVNLLDKVSAEGNTTGSIKGSRVTAESSKSETSPYIVLAESILNPDEYPVWKFNVPKTDGNTQYAEIPSDSWRVVAYAADGSIIGVAKPTKKTLN